MENINEKELDIRDTKNSHDIDDWIFENEPYYVSDK